MPGWNREEASFVLDLNRRAVAAMWSPDRRKAGTRETRSATLVVPKGKSGDGQKTTEGLRDT